MSEITIENDNLLSLSISADEKALILRAVALQNTDLTDFVIRTAVQAAREIIDRVEPIQLSSRDSSRVLDLLENPPAPNAKLLAAARALPDSV